MDIPRSANSLSLIAVLPPLLMPLSHAEGDDFYFLLVVCLTLTALIVAILFNYGFYMRKTPLVRIDEVSLTFFGSFKSEQRGFQRNTISSIKVSRRPYFWRSAFRFSVTTNAEKFDLWIPHSSRGSIAALARALRNEFPGKFQEL